MAHKTLNVKSSVLLDEYVPVEEVQGENKTTSSVIESKHESEEDIKEETE